MRHYINIVSQPIEQFVTEADENGTRATRFIITAEKWLEKSVTKFGIHTPEMDEAGPLTVRMTPVVFPPKRGPIAAAVIEHFGKLADVLGVTVVVNGVSDENEKLYVGFVRRSDQLVRVPQPK